MAKLNAKTVIKLALLILGLLLLFTLINRVGLLEIVKIISGAKINFLIYGVVVYLVLILIRSSKWFFLILATGTKITFKEFLPFYGVNCLMGNITPFKTGEATIPFLLKRYLKIPVGWGFSVIILDRFFEVVIFTLIFVAAVIHVINSGVAGGLVLAVFWWALISLIILISILVIVVASKRTAFKIIKALSFFKKFSLIKKVLDFAEKELEIFYDGLSMFRNKKVYKFIIPLTLLCWFLELFSFYLVMSSVLPASFLNVATAQLVSIAAALLTFIPVGIGIGEMGIVYVLNLFNYPAALSASGALLVRFFITGTLFAVGVIGTLLLKEKKERE